MKTRDIEEMESGFLEQKKFDLSPNKLRGVGLFDEEIIQKMQLIFNTSFNLKSKIIKLRKEKSSCKKQIDNYRRKCRKIRFSLETTGKKFVTPKFL